MTQADAIVEGIQLGEHEMFYVSATPPKQLEREALDSRVGVPVDLLVDQNLGVAIRLEMMQRLVRSAPGVDLPIYNGAIGDFRIQDCPPQASRLVEYQRGITSPGNMFSSVPFLKHLFAVYDEDGDPLGSVALTDPDEGAVQRLQFQSHRDAIENFDMGLLRPVSDTELDLYLRRFPTFFAPDSEFTTKTDFTDLPVLIPLETGLQCMQFLDACGDSHAHREKLFSFLKKYKQAGLLALLGLNPQANVPEQIDRLYDFSLDRLGISGECIEKFVEVMLDVEPVEHQFSDKKAAQPITRRITQMASALMQIVLEDYAKPDFNWKLTYTSFAALQDILSGIYRLPVPADIPQDAAFRGTLTDYALAHAGDPKRLQLILPVLELLWLEKLREYTPGAFQEQSTRFYERMGKYLHESASKTTGDTEQELARLRGIFDWLITSDRWHKGDRIMDVGSADGERILRPLIISSQLQTHTPSFVYAVDKDSYREPADHTWTMIRKDFTDPDFVTIVDKPVDVITHTWSPICDLDSPDQKKALDNFNSVLKKGGTLVLDIPAGYLEEMMEYQRVHRTKVLGRIAKKFRFADGAEVEKEFHIGEQYDIIGRAAMSGFRCINIPDTTSAVQGVPPAFYETGAGNKRVTLILEKIGEPTTSLDQLALQLRQKPS